MSVTGTSERESRTGARPGQVRVRQVPHLGFRSPGRRTPPGTSGRRRCGRLLPRQVTPTRGARGGPALGPPRRWTHPGHKERRATVAPALPRTAAAPGGTPPSATLDAAPATSSPRGELTARTAPSPSAPSPLRCRNGASASTGCRLFTLGPRSSQNPRSPPSRTARARACK